MYTPDYSAIDEKLTELGLAIVTRFVPASIAAENATDPEWTKTAINFTVTITANGREIYHGPYAYDVGNLPGYSFELDRKVLWNECTRKACEVGVWPKGGHGRRDGNPSPFVKKVPAPELRDVMHSLTMNASALDHACFEDWANDCGYDADSRRAESIYQACLNTALRLRNAFGSEGLDELRELFADY